MTLTCAGCFKLGIGVNSKKLNRINKMQNKVALGNLNGEQFSASGGQRSIQLSYGRFTVSAKADVVSARIVYAF